VEDDDAASCGLHRGGRRYGRAAGVIVDRKRRGSRPILLIASSSDFASKQTFAGLAFVLASLRFRVHIGSVTARHRALIGDENAGCTPAQFTQGKESAMGRRSQSHIDDNLNAERARIIAELENTQPGPQRDLLERNLRQLETASHIDVWLTSPGLQPLRN
jgi:hypothetical protein